VPTVPIETMSPSDHRPAHHAALVQANSASVSEARARMPVALTSRIKSPTPPASRGPRAAARRPRRRRGQQHREEIARVAEGLEEPQPSQAPTGPTGLELIGGCTIGS